MNKPCRMCMVCRERKRKNELVRVVKNKSGEINIDESGKAEGRGAYICKEGDCYTKIIKTKALNKTFHENVSPLVYEKILDKLNK